MYNLDDYSQGCSQIKDAFKAGTRDDIHQPNVSDNDFRSSNDGDDFGYILYVFDMRYQKNLEASETINVEFKIPENNPAGI